MNKYFAIVIIVLFLSMSIFFVHRIVDIPSTELLSTVVGVVVGLVYMLFLISKLKLKPKG